MQFGVFLPISGRAAGRHTLMDAAINAETWGFDCVWAADRIVIPWQIDTPYPYSEHAQFIVPPDRPFLESLTCLAFLAGCTEKIRLGISVLVITYRNPLYWAKIASTIDALSEGRFILGVGIGWMVEEFEALGVPFKERGQIADEQLRIMNQLWDEEKPHFEGRFYRFENIAFYPKAFSKSRIPVWVGGEGGRAQRRAAVYGNAWFPYFVRITPRELASRFDKVRDLAREAGRDPNQLHLNCCLPIEVTTEPVPQEGDCLKGTPAQLVQAIAAFKQVGVEHMALQFMVPRWPARLEQMERFATEVMPHV